MEIQAHRLGRSHYQTALELQSHGKDRNRIEVFWFEPEPVITLGLRAEPLAGQMAIEVLRVSRGGAATFHGPGQILFFPACHLPTWGLSVREWVCRLLQVTKLTLRDFQIDANWELERPGLYTRSGKIASVGLRIQGGWSHHGLALNVTGDLHPFSEIVTCGVANARMDQMSQWLGDGVRLEAVAAAWVLNFCAAFAG